MVSVTNGSGTVTYAYSAPDDLLSLTDPSGATTTFTYDAEGELATVIDPNGTTSFTYGPSASAPEPSSFALLFTGLVGLVGGAIRRKRG